MRTLVAAAGLVFLLVLVGAGTTPSPAAPRSTHAAATVTDSGARTRAAAGSPRLPTEGALRAAAPTGTGDLYAINHLTRHVVRLDLVGGRWQTAAVGTGLVDPVHLGVAADGTAWVIDAGPGNGRLVRVAPDGSQRTVRWLGSAGTAALSLDPRGNVFVLDGWQLVKIAASGAFTVSVAVPAVPVGDPLGLGVDGAGRPTVVGLTPIRGTEAGVFDVSTSTYPALGGAPVVRALDEYVGGSYDLLATELAPSGTLVLHVDDGSGSRLATLDRFEPNGTTVSHPTTKKSDSVAAFDAGGRLYVMEDRRWCNYLDELYNGCVKDQSVDRVLVYPPAGGTPTSLPVGNLALPAGDVGSGELVIGDLAVAAAGRMYLSGGTATTTGPLSVVPASGGAGQPMLAGRFTDLTVPIGK